MSLRLSDMLTEDRIRCGVSATDWREVVRLTGMVMEDASLIQARYTQAMIELIEEAGPYLVIAPGIALLHARPDDGVRRAGMVLLTLSTPVAFGHSSNDPVWLVIGLAAESNKAHIHAMADLATLLSKPGILEDMRDCSTSQEMIGLIHRYAGDEG